MKRIDSIKIERLNDEDADTSYIGQYTDDAADWNIERNSGEYVANLTEEQREAIPQHSREYRFFKPYAGGEKAGTEEYQKYGKQDFQRMESLQRGNWRFIGIRAVAKIVVNDTIQKITSGGLWGTESDSGNDYLSQVGSDEFASLKIQLLELGFTAEQIDAAEIEELD